MNSRQDAPSAPALLHVVDMKSLKQGNAEVVTDLNAEIVIDTCQNHLRPLVLQLLDFPGETLQHRLSTLAPENLA